MNQREYAVFLDNLRTKGKLFVGKMKDSYKRNLVEEPFGETKNLSLYNMGGTAVRIKIGGNNGYSEAIVTIIGDSSRINSVRKGIESKTGFKLEED